MGEAPRVADQLAAAMLVANSAEIAHHSDDVVVIAEAISDDLGIDGQEKADLLATARLHDVGKVSISSTILNKTGPLTPEEWEVMREHTVIGEQILSSVPELRRVARMVRHSHERWDGAGYPDGLAGDEIPLGSRIVFCADAFHAIRCDRPYRSGVSAHKALAEVRRCSGTQFDPQVVAALGRVFRRLHGRTSYARAKRSTRLAALLLLLTLGGSALAQSGVLGDAHPPGKRVPGKGCPPAGCTLPFFGPSLLAPSGQGDDSGADRARPQGSARGPKRRKPRSERPRSALGGGPAEVDDGEATGGGGAEGGSGKGKGKGKSKGGSGSGSADDTRSVGGGGNGNGNGKSKGNGNGGTNSNAGGNGKSNAGGNGGTKKAS